jgi:hypothetical protein
MSAQREFLECAGLTALWIHEFTRTNRTSFLRDFSCDVVDRNGIPIRGPRLMAEVNRSVLIVKPRQPFLDWARSLDEEDKDLKLENISSDSTAYLVPQIWDDAVAESIVEWCYDILFELELGGWCVDPDTWPKTRDLPTFLEWFTVEYHSLALDLCDEPITNTTDDFVESEANNGH